MATFIVIGEPSEAVKYAMRKSKKGVTTTYSALVNEPQHLSNIVYPSPDVIVFSETPPQQYAVDFAKVLSRMEMIPCDRKGKCFTRRKAPTFIFCMQPHTKPLDFPAEIEVIRL